MNNKTCDKLGISQGYEMLDGKKIPRIGCGTYKLKPGDETKQAVLAALEAGYRHIDCARLYGNEKSIGEALAESDIVRDELFVTSKVWNVPLYSFFCPTPKLICRH